MTIHYLWNAELRGTIRTDLGELLFRVITHRDDMLHTIDVISSERHADGRQAEWRWEFLPGSPDSPRFQIIARERARLRAQSAAGIIEPCR